MIVVATTGRAASGRGSDGTGRELAAAITGAHLVTGVGARLCGWHDAPAGPQRAIAADACHTFAETGKQVCGRFLAYWQANGGLAQQGFPLSNELSERNPVDGKTYTVQYFERAIFEYHPEQYPPYDVLLSLLGRESFLTRYPAGPTRGIVPLAAGQQFTISSYPACWMSTRTAAGDY